MLASDLVLLIGGVTTVLITVGGGLKYLIDRSDAKEKASLLIQSEARAVMSAETTKAQLSEAAARERMSERIYSEIDSLKNVIEGLKERNGLYLKRVYQLEGFIHQQPGIEIPFMEGWPPYD